MKQLVFAGQMAHRTERTTPLGVRRRGRKDTPENVKRVGKGFRIIGAFNEFARSRTGVSQSAYDEHMGSVTAHYDVMKALLRRYEELNLFLTRGHKQELRIIDVGCGTGEMMAFLLREFYLKLIREVRLRLTVVLADPAENMLEIAVRKLEGIGMQINGGNGELVVLPLLQHADLVTMPAGQETGFDIAMYTYVAPWFVDGRLREKSYARGRSLLREGGRLVSLEEDPLLITPSLSLPEGFERTLAECADPIKPKDLRKLLEKNRFKMIDRTDLVIPIDEHHSMYGKVYSAV
ncbi:class I SAM-dependent methyltransferase [Candidatus Micrarchaeota archaeon]|nr:class I SAM-dependent methyltransferase [Candidatus Micrarchaeota archaeon]